MDNKFIEKKSKLEEDKEKIRIRERQLKEKEKRIRAKRFVDIGRMAFNLDIDALEHEVLFGAFLEIVDKSKDKAKVAEWKKRAEAFHQERKKSKNVPLSVCFKEVPKKEVKEKFKELGFRWHSFRKEFYGNGDESSLNAIVKGLDCKIEVLS